MTCEKVCENDEVNAPFTNTFFKDQSRITIFVLQTLQTLILKKGFCNSSIIIRAKREEYGETFWNVMILECSIIQIVTKYARNSD